MVSESQAKIRVFGKVNCGKCLSAKEKLKMMGFAYSDYDLMSHVVHHEGWREDDSVSILAAHADLDTMPIIFIDDEYYDYSGAMKVLKSMKREAVQETAKSAS